MASTIKVTNINTPDGTGNITVDRPLSGSGASLTSLPAANLTGTLPAIDGSNLTGVSGGKILQGPIIDIHTARETTTSTTKVQVDTDWSATITPSATSSKILIQMQFHSNLSYPSVEKKYAMTVYRDSTDVEPIDGIWFQYSVSTSQWWTNHLWWVDSPNSTSALEYKPYWWVESGGSWLLGGTNNTTDCRSLLYLWEIGA